MPDNNLLKYMSPLVTSFDDVVQVLPSGMEVVQLAPAKSGRVSDLLNPEEPINNPLIIRQQFSLSFLLSTEKMNDAQLLFSLAPFFQGFLKEIAKIRPDITVAHLNRAPVLFKMPGTDSMFFMNNESASIEMRLYVPERTK
jgi:hypothetical protein